MISFINTDLGISCLDLPTKTRLGGCVLAGSEAPTINFVLLMRSGVTALSRHWWSRVVSKIGVGQRTAKSPKSSTKSSIKDERIKL
jgi:hypothetical protein